MIHIYCGDGKGKTTAGMGLCLRAAGAGKKVFIYQFLKDNTSSERNILKNIPEITLMPGPEKMKFLFSMTPEEKSRLKAEYAGLIEAFKHQLQSGLFTPEVIFLDEVLYAVSRHMVDEDALLELLACGKDREWILTGRYEGKRLKDAADYISVLHKEKHPFDDGVPARAGIEF
jgi:cob(I)alamin adenosyltransferase